MQEYEIHQRDLAEKELVVAIINLRKDAANWTQVYAVHSHLKRDAADTWKYWVSRAHCQCNPKHWMLYQRALEAGKALPEESTTVPKSDSTEDKSFHDAIERPKSVVERANEVSRWISPVDPARGAPRVPATDASTRRRDKAEEDPSIRRKDKPREATYDDDSDVEDEQSEDYTSSDIYSLVHQYSEGITIVVIRTVLEVFNSSDGFFALMSKFGKPGEVIFHLMEKYELTYDEIHDMYESELHEDDDIVPSEVRSRASASSSVQPRTTITERGERSRTPTQRKKANKIRARSPSGESEHSSVGDPPRRPQGTKQSVLRRELPAICDWGGPKRGYDADDTFLSDDRTGSAKAMSNNASESEWEESAPKDRFQSKTRAEKLTNAEARSDQESTRRSRYTRRGESQA